MWGTPSPINWKAHAQKLADAIEKHRNEPDEVEAPMDGGEGMVMASNRHAKDKRLYTVLDESPARMTTPRRYEGSE